MVDYVALKAEIAKPAYNGLTDAATAVAVMNATMATESPVTGASIGQLWARRGILGIARERAMRGSITPVLTAAQKANAWTALEIVERDGFSGLDPNNTTQRAALVTLLDSFVTDTIMTAADKTATLALLAKVRTGRDVFGTLDENDIARARVA